VSIKGSLIVCVSLGVFASACRGSYHVLSQWIVSDTPVNYRCWQGNNGGLSAKAYRDKTL